MRIDKIDEKPQFHASELLLKKFYAEATSRTMSPKTESLSAIAAEIRELGELHRRIRILLDGNEGSILERDYKSYCDFHDSLISKKIALINYFYEASGQNVRLLETRPL